MLARGCFLQRSEHGCVEADIFSFGGHQTTYLHFRKIKENCSTRVRLSMKSNRFGPKLS
jgi:hypothetical protein